MCYCFLLSNRFKVREEVDNDLGQFVLNHFFECNSLIAVGTVD